MFTLKRIEKSKDAAQYFSKDNYYTKDQNIEHSEWEGLGAEDQNLKGRINPEVFEKLLEGEIEGAKLGRIEKGQYKHRSGYDLTMSAPKSVSILSEVFDDKEVRFSHIDAVKKTLKYIENNYLETRLYSKGKTHRVRTDNGIFALFTHDVSRELDPQLHTHSVLINATKVNGEYKSLAPEKLYQNQKLLGAIYRQHLANNLTHFGFKLNYDSNDKTIFEIDGVSKELINEFSERRNQILQYFEDHDLEYDTKKAKQVALLTRQKKREVDREKLMQIWAEKANKYPLPKDLKNRQIKPLPLMSLETALNQAIDHLSERNAAFTKDELFIATLQIDEKINPEKILNSINKKITANGLIEAPNHPDKKSSKKYYTTLAMIELERSLTQHIKQGKNQLKAIGKENSILNHLNKTQLNDQQKASVLASLQSKDRVFGIQGDAGVGKTTLLAEYKKLLKKEGFDVLAMAPSYQATNELSKSLGIQGVVVDRFLVDESLHQKKSKNENKTVWIVDEASMLDTAKVVKILEESEKQNARVLFVGDHKQLESVGAGRAFYQMQNDGMDYAVVNKRMRQKTDVLKSVVSDVIENRFSEAIDTLQHNDSVIEHSADDVALKTAANKWFGLDVEERKTTVIIAPANAQREQIDQHIRMALIDEKTIDKHSVEKTILRDSYLTNQEKRMSKNYQIGDIVRFNKAHLSTNKDKTNGIKANEYFTVKGLARDDNKLVLKANKGGRVITIEPVKYNDIKKGGIQHYKKDRISMASGEQLRWLDNKNKHGLKRNTQLTVERVSDNFIRVRENDTGKSHRIDTGKDTLLHVAHNYSKTAYAVQGETVKHAIVVADSKRSNTLNRKSFLVGVTRASEKVTLITNDVRKLSQALSDRTGMNTVAIELTQDKKKRQQRMRLMQQNNIIMPIL